MLINSIDNVYVNIDNGHKYAARDIKAGENIIKYGQPIGKAVCDIKKDEHVHSHNVKTNLSGKNEYTYEPVDSKFEIKESNRTFLGYIRENGDVGIRNDIWIVNTVGCVNKSAELIASVIVFLFFLAETVCVSLSHFTVAPISSKIFLSGTIVLPSMISGFTSNSIGFPSSSTIISSADTLDAPISRLTARLKHKITDNNFFIYLHLIISFLRVRQLQE